MSHEDGTRSPNGVSAPAERIESFEAAIAAVARHTRALHSAITEVAFADAAGYNMASRFLVATASSWS